MAISTISARYAATKWNHGKRVRQYKSLDEQREYAVNKLLGINQVVKPDVKQKFIASQQEMFSQVYTSDDLVTVLHLIVGGSRSRIKALLSALDDYFESTGRLYSVRFFPKRKDISKPLTEKQAAKRDVANKKRLQKMFGVSAAIKNPSAETMVDFIRSDEDGSLTKVIVPIKEKVRLHGFSPSEIEKYHGKKK